MFNVCFICMCRSHHVLTFRWCSTHSYSLENHKQPLDQFAVLALFLPMFLKALHYSVSEIRGSWGSSTLVWAIQAGLWPPKEKNRLENESKLVCSIKTDNNANKVVPGFTMRDPYDESKRSCRSKLNLIGFIFSLKRFQYDWNIIF